MAEKEENARIAFYPKSNPSRVRYGAWISEDMAKAWVKYINKKFPDYVHFVEYKTEKDQTNG